MDEERTGELEHPLYFPFVAQSKLLIGELEGSIKYKVLLENAKEFLKNASEDCYHTRIDSLVDCVKRLMKFSNKTFTDWSFFLPRKWIPVNKIYHDYNDKHFPLQMLFVFSFEAGSMVVPSSGWLEGSTEVGDEAWMEVTPESLDNLLAARSVYESD